MKVSKWVYFWYSIEHWMWCTLHYPDNFMRRITRRLNMRAANGYIGLLILFFLIAFAIAGLNWLYVTLVSPPMIHTLLNP